MTVRSHFHTSNTTTAEKLVFSTEKNFIFILNKKNKNYSLVTPPRKCTLLEWRSSY